MPETMFVNAEIWEICAPDLFRFVGMVDPDIWDEYDAACHVYPWREVPQTRAALPFQQGGSPRT